MKKNIVVIVGGPGSGKTTIIDYLKTKGFCCFEEVSREITAKAQADGIEQLFLTDPVLFSKLVLEGRQKQYINARECEEKLVFLDRGLPDVVAYLDYFGTSYPKQFDVVCKKHFYSHVFILPPWEEIYRSDAERYENFEQAQKIHENIINSYKKLGYQLIAVPKESIEVRTEFILKEIEKIK